MATKIPGGKPPEKEDKMLDPGYGIGSNGELATPAVSDIGNPPPVAFFNDHQLPPTQEGPEQGGLLDAETLKKLKAQGTVIEFEGPLRPDGKPRRF